MKRRYQTRAVVSVTSSEETKERLDLPELCRCAFRVCYVRRKFSLYIEGLERLYWEHRQPYRRLFQTVHRNLKETDAVHVARRSGWYVEDDLDMFHDNTLHIYSSTE